MMTMMAQLTFLRSIFSLDWRKTRSKHVQTVDKNVVFVPVMG